MPESSAEPPAEPPAEPSGTLLTDATRAWADRTYPVRRVTVTAGDIRRFAYATGETDPVHLDREAAIAAGFRDLVAPPMFYVFLRVAPHHLRPRAELEADGSPSEDIPPVAIKGAMAGETELELAGSFYAGDEVDCHKRLADLTEKVGRSGPLLFLTFEYRYDVAGETVVRERFTRILR
jgi:3-methylfumaryl-CoA hydratase